MPGFDVIPQTNGACGSFLPCRIILLPEFRGSTIRLWFVILCLFLPSDRPNGHSYPTAFLKIFSGNGLKNDPIYDFNNIYQIT